MENKFIQIIHVYNVCELRNIHVKINNVYYQTLFKRIIIIVHFNSQFWNPPKKLTSQTCRFKDIHPWQYILF